jgi:hypothetical protein
MNSENYSLASSHNSKLPTKEDDLRFVCGCRLFSLLRVCALEQSVPYRSVPYRSNLAIASTQFIAHYISD